MRKTSENIIILLKFVRMMYTQMIIYKRSIRTIYKYTICKRKTKNWPNDCIMVSVCSLPFSLKWVVFPSVAIQ